MRDRKRKRLWAGAHTRARREKAKRCRDRWAVVWKKYKAHGCANGWAMVQIPWNYFGCEPFGSVPLFDSLTPHSQREFPNASG